MARILVTCPSGCGDKSLDERSVHSHTFSASGTHTLTYRCPQCRLIAQLALDDETLARCRAAGVAHDELTPPAELCDADRSLGRDAPTFPELAAAMAALDDIDSVDGLLAACSRR